MKLGDILLMLDRWHYLRYVISHSKFVRKYGMGLAKSSNNKFA